MAQAFRSWAADHGIERRLDAALQKLITSASMSQRVADATYCFADIGSSDFPAPLQDDLEVLRSISGYIIHRSDGSRSGANIPRKMLPSWVQSFIRIRDHMLIAKGRYDLAESRAKDADI